MDQKLKKGEVRADKRGARWQKRVDLLSHFFYTWLKPFDLVSRPPRRLLKEASQPAPPLFISPWSGLGERIEGRSHLSRGVLRAMARHFVVVGFLSTLAGGLQDEPVSGQQTFARHRPQCRYCAPLPH